MDLRPINIMLLALLPRLPSEALFYCLCIFYEMSMVAGPKLARLGKVL